MFCWKLEICLKVVYIALPFGMRSKSLILPISCWGKNTVSFKEDWSEGEKMGDVVEPRKLLCFMKDAFTQNIQKEDRSGKRLLHRTL